MAKSKPEPNSDADVEDKSKLTAPDIVREWDTHWTYAKGTYHQRWQDAWNITNNIRINYGYEGTADTFIPLTFSIIESTKANVIGGRPKLTFLPTNEDQTADTTILDSAADYVWDKGYYQQRVVDWVDGALTNGTAILQIVWDTKLDIPVPRYIPIKDFWIDPTATSLEHAERENLPCGYRYLTTAEALKGRQVVNPEFDDKQSEGDSNSRYVNYYDHAAIDRAGEYKGTQTDAADKNMWQGSTLGDDAKTKQVEVIVRLKGDSKIEVINRKEIIADTESDVEDMYPFAALYDFKDPSLFYGRGHVDVLKQRQEELNDVDNQDTDNMSFQLDSIKWVDPTYAHLIPEIVSGAGVVIPIPQNMMGELARPAYNPKAKEKREEIKDDMREAVGAGEVLQGIPPQHDQTATEINAQQLNAGKRFDVMIQQMETGGFQRLAKLMFKYLQKYADKEFVVRVVGNKGVRFEKFLKEDYPGDWDPRVQLDASAKTEQARAAQMQGQMFTQYSQNPLINLMELSKLDLRKQYGLDDQEVELLLSNPGQSGDAQQSDGTQAPAQAMAQPGAMPMNGPTLGPNGAPLPPQAPAAPPGPTPDPTTGLMPADFVKLYQAAATAGDHELMDQIEAKLGFSPSTELPVAYKAQAVLQGDQQLKAALAIQDQQHEHEQAGVQNQTDMIDHAMAIQSHQQSMEAPVEAPAQ
jgi:hypothetical protein